MVPLAVLASGAFALAQTPPVGAASLPTARQQFDRDLTQATLPEMRQYVSELKALEKRASSARDYAGAIEVSRVRKAAEAELEVMAKRAEQMNLAQPTNTPASIQLSAAKAKLEGTMYDAKADEITGWAKAASATWTLPNLPPGGYDVVLHYSCTATEGGSVVVKEAFYNLTRDIKAPTQGIAQLALGTLRIRDGAGSLTLTARSVLGGNLMHLHAVELIPVSH